MEIWILLKLHLYSQDDKAKDTWSIHAYQSRPPQKFSVCKALISRVFVDLFFLSEASSSACNYLWLDLKLFTYPQILLQKLFLLLHHQVFLFLPLSHYHEHTIMLLFLSPSKQTNILIILLSLGALAPFFCSPLNQTPQKCYVFWSSTFLHCLKYSNQVLAPQIALIKATGYLHIPKSNDF